MKFEQLQYLVQVYHWGSMNKASQYCHVSHQFLSRSLKQLESELNISLFQKGAHPLTLTKEGEMVYNQALIILNAQSTIYNSLKQLNPNEISSDLSNEPPLNICYCPGLNCVIDPIAYNLISQYPSIQINSHHKNLGDCRAELENSFYDFILVHDSKAHLSNHTKYASQYHLKILEENSIYLYINKNHPLSSKKTIYFRDIKDMPLVVYSASAQPSSSLFSILCEHNISLNLTSSVNSIETYQYLIASTSHIGIGSAPSLPNINSNIISVPIHTSIVICTALFINKSHIHQPYNRVFADIVDNTFADTIYSLY